MKTIGLLGGMSWESTQLYYQLINRATQAKLGGIHSARCVIYSFDFTDIEALQEAGDWAGSGRLLGNAAGALRDVGCNFVLVCTNTMHAVADDIERISGLPLLHIADPTIEAIRSAQITTVGLLGTRYTMERPFFKERLERAGIRVLIPSCEERAIIHDVIYGELVRGVVREDSRSQYLTIIQRLAAEGAEGMILGCTEIGMLVKQGDASIPCFDTTELHALAAVERACEAAGY